MIRKLVTLLMLISVNAYAATITTPNMSLILPVPGTQPGPIWAQNLNTAFQLVDSHNHAPGSGLPVPTAGLNINADLQFRNYNLVNPRSIMFTNQASTLSTSADANNIYVVNGNLYFNNSAGTPVQVTSGNSVNVSGVGGITGLGGTTAALTYNNTLKSFTFTKSSGVTADISAGTYSLFADTAGANAISLKSPASVTSSYSLTFPSAIATTTSVLSSDTSGNMSFVSYDALAASISSTGANAIANTRTRSTGSSVGIGGVAISASSGSYGASNTSFVTVPNLSVTITTSGRPVVVALMSDNSGSPSSIDCGITSGYCYFQIARNTSTQVALYRQNLTTNSANLLVPSSVLHAIDVVGAGTYTYTVNIKGTTTSGSTNITNAILIAYEL